MFSGFTRLDIEVNGVRLRGRVGPDPHKAPLLLLHGHPESHLMWHRVVPALAEDYFIVAPDLRGYGDSGRPAPSPDHSTYSKREMARDCIALMEALGHQRFFVAGHDRGARVAARLAADAPGRVIRAMLLDVAPTLDMYEDTSLAFATAYWHWFYLIQPAPMPETLIGANPRAYVEGVMGARHAGLTPFPQEVLDHYVQDSTEPTEPAAPAKTTEPPRPSTSSTTASTAPRAERSNPRSACSGPSTASSSVCSARSSSGATSPEPCQAMPSTPATTSPRSGRRTSSTRCATSSSSTNPDPHPPMRPSHRMGSASAVMRAEISSPRRT